MQLKSMGVASDDTPLPPQQYCVTDSLGSRSTFTSV